MENRGRAERTPRAVTHQFALGDVVELCVQNLEELLRRGRIAFLRRREQRGNLGLQGRSPRLVPEAEYMTFD